MLLAHGCGLLRCGPTTAALMVVRLAPHPVLQFVVVGRLLLHHGGAVDGLVHGGSLHACVLAQVVIRVVGAVVAARIDKACANLALVLGNQLVELKVDPERAFLFRHSGLILHSREEEAILRQIGLNVALRVLR